MRKYQAELCSKSEGGIIYDYGRGGTKPANDLDVHAKGTMKALVYHGHGKIAWEDKPRPAIQHPGDAVVRLTTSTICGTDLHILRGDLPAVTDGRILGHEGIGIIEQVGLECRNFTLGTRSSSRASLLA